jgi:S1-C subfamily serine protease
MRVFQWIQLGSMTWPRALLLSAATAAYGFSYGRLISKRHEPIERPRVLEKPALGAARPAPFVPRQERTPTALKPRTLLAGLSLGGFGPKGGVLLGEVSPGSLPDLLGLRSGDEIVTLNGYRTSDATEVLQAYTALELSDRFIASIIRQGEVWEINYIVH